MIEGDVGLRVIVAYYLWCNVIECSNHAVQRVVKLYAE